MATEDQDKTEDPTSYRLDEARKRGEVAKSADATGVAVMSAFAIVLLFTAGWVAISMAHATRDTLGLAGANASFGPGLLAWLRETWSPVWQALTPLTLALIATAIVANFAQTGPVFSIDPISPDFKRLNPVATFKRLFSMKTLWELGKMTLRLLLLAALCWFVYGEMRALVESIAATPTPRLPALALRAFGKVSLYVLLILALTALLDVIVTRRQFFRKMRTSRRELKDEHKKRDGDPEVKSKQKQLIRELLKKARSVPKAAEADVILTNPTHYAVALKYNPESMRAPVILTKGTGFMAARIREIATRNGVPILRSPALARALYREAEIEQPVPELLYAQLAPVYRWLFSRRNKKQVLA
jgi:flagellar biosynthetic protein FlhB